MGELVGLQYLYEQTSRELPPLAATTQKLEEDEDYQDDSLGDEGFEDSEMVFPTHPETTVSQPILHYPTEAEYQQMSADTVLGN